MESFFAELKRRNVYKVAAAYAVVAWLLIQAASILFPTFEAPPWVMKVFVAVIAAGFPLALVFAWAFELTPQGLKRTEEVPPDQSITRTTGRKLLVLVTLLALAAAGLLMWQLTRRGSSRSSATNREPSNTSSIPLKSIAVLPFASLSEDKTNAYFADGIQDEILTRLSKIAQLKVISRTSTQQFQSKPASVSDIAKQLGVAHVLEGSVQKAGDSVRVNVQLIKAEGDSHLWAETYDRKLTDIFAVESEVAQRIASSLEAKLTGHEKEAINYVGTKVPEAYDAYLRAIALRNSQSREDLERFIAYCRQAVELDPNYAAAWADLAIAEGFRYVQGQHVEAQKATAKHAAETALRLDPDGEYGHAALGMYLYYCERDYDNALVALGKAREQAPSNALTAQAIALVKRRQGKLDESTDILLEAAQLDPRNEDIWANLAWSYRGMRRFADARHMYERAMAIAPNDRGLRVRLAATVAAEGDLASAARIYQEGPPPQLGTTGYGAIPVLLAYQRRFDDGVAKLSADLEQARGKNIAPMAIVYAQFQLGAMHRFAGHADEARTAFSAARAGVRAVRQQGNDGADVRAAMVMLAACLGDRNEMEQLLADYIAWRAKDRWTGPVGEEDAARAYCIIGDTDRALSILQRLITQSYADCITPALLRMDPIWDPLRKNPEFRKLADVTQ